MGGKYLIKTKSHDNSKEAGKSNDNVGEVTDGVGDVSLENSKEAGKSNDYGVSEGVLDLSGWEGGCGHSTKFDDYISGGKVSIANSYPWMVRILGWVRAVVG